MNILIIGAKGQVGSEIVKKSALSKHQIIPISRTELDATECSKVFGFLNQLNPDLIINAAAFTAVDKAEDEPILVQKINRDFVLELALFCKEKQIPLIHISTDYVFDGCKKEAYLETDEPNPQGVYAKTKWAAEQAIQNTLREHLILRVSWVFGTNGTNFVKTILNLSLSKDEIKIVADQWGNPTAAADVARVVLELVDQSVEPSFKDWGIYHYSGLDSTNWYEFACCFIKMAKKQLGDLKIARLVAINSDEYTSKVQRPKNSVLDTHKIQNILGIKPHQWQDYLPELIAHFVKLRKEL